MKLLYCGWQSASKAVVTGLVLHIDAIEEQHMKMNIQVQCLPKAINQAHCDSLSFPPDRRQKWLEIAY